MRFLDDVEAVIHQELLEAYDIGGWDLLDRTLVMILDQGEVTLTANLKNDIRWDFLAYLQYFIFHRWMELFFEGGFRTRERLYADLRNLSESITNEMTTKVSKSIREIVPSYAVDLTSNLQKCIMSVIPKQVGDLFSDWFHFLYLFLTWKTWPAIVDRFEEQMEINEERRRRLENLLLRMAHAGPSKASEKFKEWFHAHVWEIIHAKLELLPFPTVPLPGEIDETSKYPEMYYFFQIFEYVRQRKSIPDQKKQGLDKCITELIEFLIQRKQETEQQKQASREQELKEKKTPWHDSEIERLRKKVTERRKSVGEENAPASKQKWETLTTNLNPQQPKTDVGGNLYTERERQEMLAKKEATLRKAERPSSEPASVPPASVPPAATIEPSATPLIADAGPSAPPAESTEIPKELFTMHVRFSLPKLHLGEQGQASIECWKIFWSVISPAKITESLLVGGRVETAGEPVYIILILNPDPRKLQGIENILSGYWEFLRVALNPMFGKVSELIRKFLRPLGQINAMGTLQAEPASEARTALQVIETQRQALVPKASSQPTRSPSKTNALYTALILKAQNGVPASELATLLDSLRQEILKEKPGDTRILDITLEAGRLRAYGSRALTGENLSQFEANLCKWSGETLPLN